MAYNTTSVAVSKSQEDIRRMLTRNGAQRFSFSEGVNDLDGREWVALEFVHAKEFDRPHLVRMAVPLKIPDEDEIVERASRSRTKSEDEFRADLYAQEARRIWRVIYFSLKSRMEAVEEEVETFEQAFLSHIVDPATGQTIWERVKPAVESGVFVIGGPGMPALGSGKLK